MENKDDDDTIEINDKEQKSSFSDELNKAGEEISGFFKKVGQKIVKAGKEMDEDITYRMDRSTALKAALKTYTISGLGIKLKVFNGNEGEKAIYIKQDDKNLEKVLNGTILIGEDNKKIMITEINKSRVAQKKLKIGKEEELFPCFRAEYDIYDIAEPKVDSIDYKN